MKSWIDIPADSDFSLANIPFGIFRDKSKAARAGTAIGNFVVDLDALSNLGYFDGLGVKVEFDFASSSIFNAQSLNAFIGLGKPVTTKVRERIMELFSAENAELRDNADDRGKVLYRSSDVEMMMPVEIGDYTDFYSSIDHATNVGTMFRDPNNALLPNWKHLPVGYHGRASSIVVSGTPIHRPKGQTKADTADSPSYGPSRLLDFELEMAFITGKPTRLGESISTAEAEDHIFGLVLFNDLSARDIQKWEYVPLGPFLGKNFGSAISPWVVTLEALEPFRTDSYKQEPAVLPYLEFEGKKNYDIQLEVALKTQSGVEKTLCHSNFKFMYWNMCQQLAHHTVNGCNINIGDLYASGTISGPTPDSYGSMLELSWRGTKPISMPDGSERKFIADNDTVIMRGWSEKEGQRVGFGEVQTKILPATQN